MNKEGESWETNFARCGLDYSSSYMYSQCDKYNSFSRKTPHEPGIKGLDFRNLVKSLLARFYDVLSLPARNLQYGKKKYIIMYKCSGLLDSTMK